MNFCGSWRIQEASIDGSVQATSHSLLKLSVVEAEEHINYIEMNVE